MARNRVEVGSMTSSGRGGPVQSLLETIAAGLPLFADLNRADVLLYEKQSDGRLLLIESAAPHSVPPVHRTAMVGDVFEIDEQPVLARTIGHRRPTRGPRQQAGFRAHIIQEAYPVRIDDEIIGVLSIEKSLVEYERHKTRRWAFRKALYDLRDMLLRGEMVQLGDLSPFQEHDGLMVVDDTGEIRYLSGLATQHYRRLRYNEDLIGEHVSDLRTADAEVVARALEERVPFQIEHKEANRIWVRKVIPLVGPRWRAPRPLELAFAHGFGPRGRVTVLIAIHDATEIRRKAEQQAVQRAMVQEIHHRVKNNLQTIASLLRIRSRRAEHEETRQILTESINRILSVAVVHEFLSQHEGQTINLRDVAARIMGQVRESILDPTKEIIFHVEGPAIYLPPQQTTICALVINELLLNSLEHAFNGRAQGEVTIRLEDEGDYVVINIEDNGAGLPEDFDLHNNSSLGLRIVQTVVQQDLRGQFEMHNGDGVSAVVTFPKGLPEQKTAYDELITS